VPISATHPFLASDELLSKWITFGLLPSIFGHVELVLR